MDGLTVLEFIGGQSKFKDLKIMVVSALDEEKLTLARSAGAHRSLAKPFKKGALLEIVKDLIGEATREVTPA